MDHCGTRTRIPCLSAQIDTVINPARKQECASRTSTNTRFLQAHYDMKRLAKVETAVEAKKKASARRDNKDDPGVMIHSIPQASPCSSREADQPPRVSVCADRRLLRKL